MPGNETELCLFRFWGHSHLALDGVRADVEKTAKIKGPDNPTSQLRPIMSFKGCSGDGEGRKDKGGGEGSRSFKTVVCDKVECERRCVTKQEGM